MWKLYRKLNFPNIFLLAAIYTWAPAFKYIVMMTKEGSTKTVNFMTDRVFFLLGMAIQVL